MNLKQAIKIIQNTTFRNWEIDLEEIFEYEEAAKFILAALKRLQKEKGLGNDCGSGT